MNDGQATSSLDDAERIRLKRLARLGTSSQSPAASSSRPESPVPAKPSPKPQPKAPVVSVLAASPVPEVAKTPVRKQPVGPVKLDLQSWEHETIGRVLKVTLDRAVAEESNWQVVWLKHLFAEIETETPQSSKPLRLSGEIVDRLLIARLELNPDSMSDDLEYLPVLASLPRETVFEYLIGCWRRHNASRSALLRKGYSTPDTVKATSILDRLRDLIISYAGLDLQEPDMFPQLSDKPIGPPELVSSLLSLSTLTDPLSNVSANSVLPADDVPQFLYDLAQRFGDEEELTNVIGPVIRGLLFHESLARPDGIGGADGSWRGIISGLEALVAVKPISSILTKLPEWNPEEATPATFEKVSLLGPLLRLSVFQREWPAISRSYFSEPEKRTRADVESSNASLRGTLKSLQASLFQVFNTLVRNSPQSREAVLQYFSRVVSLNVKRGGMQVDFDTVASDGFMINLQIILLRFAEPFMDAKYSKIDKIDPQYLGRSSRVDVKEETRIKASAEEVGEWEKSVKAAGGPDPNFISDIFYLASAMNHYGLNRALQTFDDLSKATDELQRNLEFLEASFRGLEPSNPFFLRTQSAINATKAEITKVTMEQFAYQVQILDPEFVFRQLGFTNFTETWLIRLVDPKHSHPTPIVEVPLPQEIPTSFKMLPEYFLEDAVDFLLFIMRASPLSFDLTGKNELVIWALTFLRSTWYIKNPFLKAKINEVLFFGTLSNGRERGGALGTFLNSHPFALKHLMPAMMSFYIEVEQTGASSQFYDKFNARRNIAYILKAIWQNPTHREALSSEAKNVDKFVRFVNLMINDVTYLMDESLSELTQIATIQHEMEQEEWRNKPLQYRREREGNLRSLERHASGYVTLGRSTVELLKIFTAETKEPFMMPEIVNKLAAMLDYNLDALAGPRCQNLKVKEREKYRFEPRALLSDILQVYLNLSGKEEFVRAVAEDGRSYSRELFERAAWIARHRSLKTDDEIQKLKDFVDKVEETKASIEAEEDLGEVPEEFLDPLMFTIMRDPVTLPTSHVVIDRSTIKAHLLSDTKDPFNRAPLSIEQVVSNTELKAKIDEFIASRRNNSKQKGSSIKDVEMGSPQAGSSDLPGV